MTDDLNGFEEFPDEELADELANRFLSAANAAGSQALTSPSNHFPAMARYRDFQARAANIQGSLLDELDPADLETAATVLGSDDLVEEIQSRRDELEQQRALRVKAEDDAAVAHLHRFQEEAAVANVAAEQREADRREETMQAAYAKVVAQRNAEDGLQRADVLERQAQALTRAAFDDDADTITLVRKAKALRDEAAEIRGRR